MIRIVTIAIAGFALLTLVLIAFAAIFLDNPEEDEENNNE